MPLLFFAELPWPFRPFPAATVDVRIEDPDGRPAEAGKLGYLVEGPDGMKQKLMAMDMQGAYGANVNFKTKGTYTVKTKFVAGDKKLLDQFSYEVK